MAPGLGPDPSVGWGSTDRPFWDFHGVSGHVATAWMVEAHVGTDGNGWNMPRIVEN
jgi:hypothetical protein